MDATILQAEGLGQYYHIEDRRVDVLLDISLAIKRGEFVVITGSSGSGKTTLLSLLSGLDTPSTGRILLDGMDISGLSEDKLAPIRNRSTGFVFQGFHLIPSLCALENVMFPAELAACEPIAQVEERARELLERVGLAGRLMSMPYQLSGGEQQRVAICRAMINRPSLLFADEPTGNLDSESSSAVIEQLLALHREQNTTLVMATHSAELAAMADRRLHLADGRLVDQITGKGEAS